MHDRTAREEQQAQGARQDGVHFSCAGLEQVRWWSATVAASTQRDGARRSARPAPIIRTLPRQPAPTPKKPHRGAEMMLHSAPAAHSRSGSQCACLNGGATSGTAQRAVRSSWRGQAAAAARRRRAAAPAAAVKGWSHCCREAPTLVPGGTGTWAHQRQRAPDFGQAGAVVAKWPQSGRRVAEQTSQEA